VLRGGALGCVLHVPIAIYTSLLLGWKNELQHASFCWPKVSTAGLGGKTMLPQGIVRVAKMIRRERLRVSLFS